MLVYVKEYHASYLLQYVITLEVHKDCYTFKWWFLSITSFHTKSSHVPGIPFCPFCPCDPFCPTDPFSSSKKKQANEKGCTGLNLRGEHVSLFVINIIFFKFIFCAVLDKRIFHVHLMKICFIKQPLPSPLFWIMTNPYQVLPGILSQVLV